MRFTKMHGIGNDYVYVNCFEEQVPDPPAAARFVSDRHFGIGADGLILIRPSDVADCEMEMYNADGSRGKMCGNGIRCVGKYVYDAGLVDKTQITVMTGSGIRTLTLYPGQDGKVERVRVDMGRPVLTPEEIPVAWPAEEEESGRNCPASGDSIISRPLAAAGQTWEVTCVSMGNPHCVTAVPDPDSFPVEQIGPYFEHHEAFPEGVNTEFIRVEDRSTVCMRVWERGSGETMACGTGACAVAVACALNGWTDDKVTVNLLGGDLQIEWDRQENRVYMTGSATTVFRGEIDLPF